MRCPSCGFENPEGLKVCNDCGAPLRIPCAQCGFANQPQAMFCGECGGALFPRVRASTAPPLASAHQCPLLLCEAGDRSSPSCDGHRRSALCCGA
jgi:hypothetical protein